MHVENSLVLIYLISLQTVFGVDMDYYYSSALRSQTLSCKNRLHQLYCQVKCGMKPAFCIQENCYCVTITSANNVSESQVEMRSDIHEDVDYGESDEALLSNDNRDTDKIFYAFRPTLRHHIAHFCPNLDVARECIKKCMGEGKPAFCGKDHVCYCGHTYSHNENDEAANAKDTYAQFKDLYIKYFGKDMTDTAEID